MFFLSDLITEQYVSSCAWLCNMLDFHYNLSPLCVCVSVCVCVCVRDGARGCVSIKYCVWNEHCSKEEVFLECVRMCMYVCVCVLT